MKNKTVRASLLSFFVVLGLCLFWNLLIEESGSLYDLFSFYYSLLVWYIPFAILTVAILLGLLSFFLQEKAKKGLRIAAGTLCAIAIIFSITMLSVSGKSMLKEENIQKNTAAEEKYQPENFVKEKELVLDTEIPMDKTSSYAMGHFFAYYTDHRYACADDDRFGMDMTACELKNVPRLLRGAMKNYMEKNYIKKVTESGELYGKQYTCYIREKMASESENRKANNLYCAILVEDGNNYSLFLLDMTYSKSSNTQISKIIETLCSS